MQMITRKQSTLFSQVFNPELICRVAGRTACNWTGPWWAPERISAWAPPRSTVLIFATSIHLSLDATQAPTKLNSRPRRHWNLEPWHSVHTNVVDIFSPVSIQAGEQTCSSTGPPFPCRVSSFLSTQVFSLWIFILTQLSRGQVLVPRE